MTEFPELEPSLVEVAIGEVDEPPNTPDMEAQRSAKPAPSDGATNDMEEKPPAATSSPVQSRKSKSVQRSQSDRYSYKAAIYKHEPDFDL